jgi:hypothetical protein
VGINPMNSDLLLHNLAFHSKAEQPAPAKPWMSKLR